MPCAVNNNPELPNLWVEDGKGKGLCIVVGMRYEKQEKAERIAACLNFCKGYSVLPPKGLRGVFEKSGAAHARVAKLEREREDHEPDK